MTNKYTGATYCEVNINRLEQNVSIINTLKSDNIKICCVLKANAYGHGAVEMTKYLYSMGLDFFAVATGEEAIELRLVGTL